MRVIGYVREAPGPEGGDTVFVQSEQIRKWVTQHRCQLVAVCQDTPTGDRPDTQDGYRALLGIIATGQVDTVLIPSVTTLSTDLITQEIILWDLRSRGVNVISADEADLPNLAASADVPARMLIRDVLDRAQDYRSGLDGVADRGVSDDQDVLIELIPSADVAPPAAQAS